MAPAQSRPHTKKTGSMPCCAIGAEGFRPGQPRSPRPSQETTFHDVSIAPFCNKCNIEKGALPRSERKGSGMRVSAVQINAHADGKANREKMATWIERLMKHERPDLIVFPEYTAFISSDPEVLRQNAEEAGRGPAMELIASLAARHKVNIHLGSLIERDGDRFYNGSFLFDRTGKIVGRYRKMHRFDVTLPDGTEILESAMVERGDQVVVLEIDGVKFGFSICYDLRFGELFRELERKGAQVLLVPAAFTQQTGIDHWEVLLRARAIENQCYVVAPGQIGSYDQGTRTSFGHTMIIDPWGLVIAQASNQETAVTADIDLAYLAAARKKLPVSAHRVLS